MVTIANSVEEIGYGFVAVKSKKTTPRTIIIHVDPEKLKAEGYVLKSKYKNQQEKFSVLIEPGQFASVIFKKRKHAEKYVWPIESIQIYRKD